VFCSCQAELASTYLPSLLRTYFNNPFNALHPNHLSSWMGLRMVLGHAMSHNKLLYFARFLEQHPDEVVSFFDIQTKRICEMADTRVSIS